MKRKAAMGLAIGLLLAGLAGWKGIGDVQGEEKKSSVKAPSHVMVQGDATVLVFDDETQKRMDIGITALVPSSRRAEATVLATVLPVQGLEDVRAAYVTAKARLDRSLAMMDASHREYERIKTLHGDGRNVSDKVLDASQAAWRADEVEAAAARDSLETQTRSASLQWGTLLVSMADSNAPLFRDLSEQRQVLLQVATPMGDRTVSLPATIQIVSDDGAIRNATLISASPQADPRIQGTGYFYATPADGLPTGVTLIAHVAVGDERLGNLVPADAVVWWQGKAWFYVQVAPDRFERRELTGAQSMDRGWFVPGPQPGPVVVQGAQLMLSEELRAQIQVGDD